MVTVAALFAVAIELMCLLLGFDTHTPVRNENTAHTNTLQIMAK